MGCDVVIVAGFGFRGAATSQSLQSALFAAKGSHTPDCIATLSDKAHALKPLSAALGIPIIVLTAADIETAEPKTQSGASLRARNTGSVAEATALAAAGPGAQLLAPRSISDDRMATCALAEGPDR